MPGCGGCAGRNCSYGIPAKIDIACFGSGNGA
jgi:hypothetical protein